MHDEDETTPDLGSGDGVRRRDALKAIALLAASPVVAGQRGSQAQPAATRAAVPAEHRRDQGFDDDWRFLRGDAPGAELPGFDDSAWRRLDLPHDFSVEDLPPRPASANGEGALWGTSVLPTRIGPFDTELSAGGRDTGWFVGGTGWYRKRFMAGALTAGSQVDVVFDGVYMNSDAWLNGTLLGHHPYGYTAFAYDLTPHLKRDGENVLAVRVRNDGRNSRWYSGSGIYRHVRLNTTGSVRVPTWGVSIRTPDVTANRATALVNVRVENRLASAQDVTVRVRLLDEKNAEVGRREATRPVAGGGVADLEQSLEVTGPQLWSPATPHLYRADVELAAGGRTTDRLATSFGIRRVDVDARQGLRLNGDVVKLKGGCLHHDNGLLGACAIDRAEERRVELMKAHGFNAIRTSHNPPSSAFLDACDRLGMLVLDEAFDQWERQKNAQDYHLYFAEWWQRDVSAMVLRDRNHPSVILWSIGNEIPERTEPRGIELAKQLVEYVKKLDPTRPVTAAINSVRGGGEALDPAFQHLDVAGYNYLPDSYEPDHARQPARVMMGTESLPRQAFPSWRPVEQHPFVIGDFVWTGMDHLGESSIGNAQLGTPGRGPGGGFGAGGNPPGGAQGRGGQATAGAAAGVGARGGAAPGTPPPAVSGLAAMMAGGSTISLPFPWFNCYCGDIDLIGQPKPQWFHRRVIWGLSTIEMAVQRPVPEGRTEAISAWGWSDELRSWTWPGSEGKTLRVRVYSSGDQVRLLLNGKEVGLKPVSADSDLKTEFEVPYAAGELKAVALSSGKPVGEVSLKTTGKPALLRLRADRSAIRRNRGDLAYVTLEVLDQAGELVPDAVVPVRFSISGAAELAAVGTANPKDVWSFRNPRPKTFHGRCLAIVRPTGRIGDAVVRAQAEGLPAVSAVVRVVA